MLSRPSASAGAIASSRSSVSGRKSTACTRQPSCPGGPAFPCPHRNPDLWPGGLPPGPASAMASRQRGRHGTRCLGRVVVSPNLGAREAFHRFIFPLGRRRSHRFRRSHRSRRSHLCQGNHPLSRGVRRRPAPHARSRSRTRSSAGGRAGPRDVSAAPDPQAAGSMVHRTGVGSRAPRRRRRPGSRARRRRRPPRARWLVRPRGRGAAGRPPDGCCDRKRHRAEHAGVEPGAAAQAGEVAGSRRGCC